MNLAWLWNNLKFWYKKQIWYACSLSAAILTSFSIHCEWICEHIKDVDGGFNQMALYFARKFSFAFYDSSQLSVCHTSCVGDLLKSFRVFLALQKWNVWKEFKIELTLQSTVVCQHTAFLLLNVINLSRISLHRNVGSLKCLIWIKLKLMTLWAAASRKLADFQNKCLD